MIKDVGRVINSQPMKMSMSDLKRQIKMDKKNWKHILTTNCYAYALKLDVPERKIKTLAYAPGTMGSSSTNLAVQRYFTLDNLLENIQDDLLYLGIKFLEVDPLEEILPNEWKIALFTAFYSYICYEEYLYDYHFLRQDSSGIWTHKMGFFHRPTNVDNNKDVIKDPKKCSLGNYDYQLTYKLSLK